MELMRQVQPEDLADAGCCLKPLRKRQLEATCGSACETHARPPDMRELLKEALAGLHRGPQNGHQLPRVQRLSVALLPVIAQYVALRCNQPSLPHRCQMSNSSVPGTCAHDAAENDRLWQG